MKNKQTQPIRRSQFIYTYGPGSIIETQNGPRLIPSLRIGLKYKWDDKILEKMEIPDVRLCQFLRKTSSSDNKCHIFAIPSNSELGIAENKAVYQTKIFPSWKICYNKEKHKTPILYRGNKCPECQFSNQNGAVRFIAACPEGHLDDINWKSAVHYKSKNHDCKSNYFFWEAKGSTLSSIVITCPECHSSVTMKDIYEMRHPCTGRLPESEIALSSWKSDTPGSCTRQMHVIQRQSTSLYLAQLVTLLTIPKYDDRISRLLQTPMIDAVIDTVRNDNEEEIATKIENSNKISEDSKNELLSFIRENGCGKLIDKYIHLNDSGTSFMDMMNEEYHSLLNGVGQSDPDIIHFRMGSSVSQKPTHLIPELTVCPVLKIRTVTTLRGYTRQVSQETPKMVSVAEKRDDGYWFPGFEGFGEGIFVHVSSPSLNSITKSKTVYNCWKNFEPDPTSHNTNWMEICHTPEFVWLHTLSHALIRAISEYTGYSSASIRERVYYDQKEHSGGILLYNTVPGEDGNMGGLTDIIGYFQDILERAEKIIRICSNDPLCSDIHRSGDRVNGSVCYGCLLISETSCEHENKWLDRQLFLDVQKQ